MSHTEKNPAIHYHYPPELLALLIDAIPLLCKSKMEVITFFKGASVPQSILLPLENQLSTDKHAVNKYMMARSVLSSINDLGDPGLKTRRDVLQRVVEFEDYSVCWPKDQLKATGLVANIRRVIGVKDSFTRMSDERERDLAETRRTNAKRMATAAASRLEKEQVKTALYEQFGRTDPHKRGKALEGILNRLFKAHDIGVREAFTVKAEASDRTIEQIDGAIEIDGHLYVVEMKWLKGPIDKGDISQHLVTVYGRSGARGLFISASGFTDPAVEVTRKSLGQITVVLCDLKEIVFALERGEDLANILRIKVRAAVLDQVPLSAL